MDIILDGLSATIINNNFKLHYNKEACIDNLIINNVNIINNLNNQRTFYLDWNGGKNRFIPNNLKLEELNENEGHIIYYQNNTNLLYIEYHIIIKENISAIYNYFIIKNNTNSNIEISELRMVCRFDPILMNYIYNGNYSFEPILYKNLNKLPKIQDETWQLENGNFYSKYDFCNYIRNINYYGVYGKNYGAWTILPTHEYYSGGPLKQDLIVHQDALMLNYFTSSHFGTPNMNLKINDYKFYGPWVTYFNYKNNINDLFDDVKNQVNIEINNYPYIWIKNDYFPINRGSLIGNVNKKSMIILNSSLNENFETQTLGNIYFNNEFNIKNIKPNIYKLSIYPLEGNNADFLYEDIINIKEGTNIYNNNIIIPNDNNIIWNISNTNRLSDSYCYSDRNRNYIWQTLVPSNIDYNIYESKENIDWYYAQTKIGSWNIKYNDYIDNNDRLLKLSLAASSHSSISQSTIPKLVIKINNIIIMSLVYENDKSIYRGALNSGNFHCENIIINKNYIINGINIITLELISGAFMYDNISYYKNI